MTIRILLAMHVALVAGIGLAQEPAKKVIEWGWDEPDTKFIRENIEKMKQYPFDGLIFHVNSSKGGNFTWEMWGGRKYDLGEFQHSIDNLNATNFQRFTDRFLRVNVTPGTTDWFDNQAWGAVLNNFGVAAQVAKEGGCKGFMFDVEQYNEGLFDYAKQKHRDSRTCEEYRAQVRQRGREWMIEVNRQFPDITVLLTFGYRIAQPPEGGERSASNYGLLADFLDGMLEACSKQTKIVDAWEYSYPYKERSQFEEAYTTVKEKSVEWTARPEEYRRHVEAGFGIWMDCRWRQVGWNLDDFSKNHFTPAEFETTVRLALDVSDEYVWIYTEQPRWWSNERLPVEYVAALKQARNVRKEEPGFRAVQCEGTYRHHLQGICTNEEDAIYWSFTTALVKTDTSGSLLKTIPVANHHGDLCFHDGRIYLAVNLGKFNDPAGNADSWVYVYDADDLSLLAKHETQEVFHGAGGIAARGGHFFVVGGLPKEITENYVYEYDGDFHFVKKHVIKSGNTLMGIQTAAFAHGCWWFGCYGNPRVLLKTDESFDLIGKYECDASLGIVGLPKRRLFVARGPCQPQKGCIGSVLVAAPDDEKGFVLKTSATTISVIYDNYSYHDALQTDWGFACLVTGSEKTILFDTGGKGEVLLSNMKKMDLSPKDVDLIVISHNHGDHTGGLLPFLKENPDLGVFLPAKTPDDFVKEVQQIAANVTVVNEPTTICNGAVVLGPMGNKIIEQALVLDTKKGLVIITGCSHPGVEVIAKKAKEELHRDIHMVLGGTHLLRHPEEDLRIVIDDLKKLGVQKVAPTHCSGDKTISMFQEAFGDGFVKMGVGRVIEIDGE